MRSFHKVQPRPQPAGDGGSEVWYNDPNAVWKRKNEYWHPTHKKSYIIPRVQTNLSFQKK